MNLQKNRQFSANISVLGSLCHLRSAPLSAPRVPPPWPQPPPLMSVLHCRALCCLCSQGSTAMVDAAWTTSPGRRELVASRSADRLGDQVDGEAATEGLCPQAGWLRNRTGTGNRNHRTVFPGTESGTGTVGTVFQELKPEPEPSVKLY